jgi:hypothetical protein
MFSFFVDLLKSCKNRDFWIDFTADLAYNSMASELEKV